MILGTMLRLPIDHTLQRSRSLVSELCSQNRAGRLATGVGLRMQVEGVGGIGIRPCSRPFGGLNVLVGDLWQLEPPEGHFVAGVLHEWLASRYARNKPAVANGQELLWGTSDAGFQGLIELVKWSARKTHGCKTYKKSCGTPD